MVSYLLSIDQGTTGTTALVVSLDGTTVGRYTCEFPQHFPNPGWVEHDPEEIWQSVNVAVVGALRAAGIAGSSIAAIGITNQRETTMVWDRATGKPIHPAIVWQCRRTADMCDELKARGHAGRVREQTGLVIDAYFSGTKIGWILDHVPGARQRADEGQLAFGTVDSFLVHRLTAGASHVTDITNASRTMLMNLARGEWDPTLLALLGVPASMLPVIVANAEVVGTTRGVGFLPDGIPIAGMAGDQQAALFGQACFDEGDAKCTYGTGAFALMNIGARPLLSQHGLVTTVAWKIGHEITYALEGSAFIAGAAVQWLRDGLGIIERAEESEALARQVESSAGVVFVPALAGLGAPYWDQDARGALVGLTRGSTAAHIARATLEGIAFEVWDLLDAMSRDAGKPIIRLRADGGASRNNLLLQVQADIANITVERPNEVESTGRGAAMLAGVGAGLCQGVMGDGGGVLPLSVLEAMVSYDARFAPRISAETRNKLLAAWRDAVARVRSTLRA